MGERVIIRSFPLSAAERREALRGRREPALPRGAGAALTRDSQACAEFWADCRLLNMDSQSKCWANLHNLSQSGEFRTIPSKALKRFNLLRMVVGGEAVGD